MFNIDEETEDNDTVIRNSLSRRSKNQTATQNFRVAFAKIMHKSNASNALTMFKTKSRLKTLESRRKKSKNELKISENRLEKLKSLFDFCLK